MSTRKMLFVFLCLLAGSGCSKPESKTVPGPESSKLRPRVAGYLLTIPNSRAITCTELPSLKQTSIAAVKAKAGDDPTIHALSGPDAQGRIAYIEDHGFVQNEKNKRHLLKTIRTDGTQETEFFSRPGDAGWAKSAIGKGEIGEHLALSPVGGRVVFLTELKDAQMPGALLSEGLIEIWDLEKKTGRKTDVRAIDDGLAWFPDGKRLAFVKLIKPQDEWKEQQAEFFGSTFSGWERVPAIYVRDMESGAETFLGVGWEPVVSPDGNSVLAAKAELKSYRRFDLGQGQGKISDVTLPGAWGRLVAWPVEDIVVSWSLPTEGAQLKYTQSNSPIVGPKPMLTLKLTRMYSNEFETVVPYIDPRDKASFGVVKGQ